LKPFKINEDLFKNKKLVRETLVECLLMNDMEALRDVLIAHIQSTSKTELVKKTGVGRRTLYDLMDETKEFNPGIKTVGALLNSIVA